MNKLLQFDIIILRIISIIIVVFFHAYGMTHASHLPANIALEYKDKYELFNQSYLINIAMPLFTVISGYLFCGQLFKQRYSSFINLTWQKAKRLLIPYYFFTAFFMITTNNISLAPFYIGGYWHLWYLPMLFWCFIVTYALHYIVSHNKSIEICVLLLFFVLALIDKFLPTFLGLYNVTKWYYWFYLGYIIKHYESHIFLAIKQYHLIYVGFVVYFITGVLLYSEYGKNTIHGMIASTIAIICIWYFARLIPWKKLSISPLLISISSCSFGIYIFHNWLEMYMLSNTAQRIFPIAFWAENHIYLFPFAFASIAFIISWGMTWLLLKCRIGKFLIG